MVEARRQGAGQVSPNVCSSEMLTALRHRNFRLYFAAQVISNVGTWVQITVENWLVLELSHSGLALGVTNALQFGPPVLFGMYGGVVADRCDRRRLLMLTQACLGLLALMVGVLACAGLPVIIAWTFALAAAQLAVAAARDLLPLLAATFAYGVSAGLFSVTVISTLQSRTVEDMRGRVTALHSICFLGVSLVSGPRFGGLAEWIGVSGALCVAASICALAALAAVIARRAMRRLGHLV